MSFLHNIYVGMFSEAYELTRSLELAEVEKIVDEFEAIALEEYGFVREKSPSKNLERGVTLGRFDGCPLILKKGILICPYLSCFFHIGAIAFSIFVSQKLGARILSPDDGIFLSVEELISEKDFAQIMRSFID